MSGEVISGFEIFIEFVNGLRIEATSKHVLQIFYENEKISFSLKIENENKK